MKKTHSFEFFFWHMDFGSSIEQNWLSTIHVQISISIPFSNVVTSWHHYIKIFFFWSMHFFVCICIFQICSLVNIYDNPFTSAFVCDGNPCNSNGSCTPVGNTNFSCSCDVGYSGPTCNGKCCLNVSSSLLNNVI